MKLFLIEANTSLLGHKRLYERAKENDSPDFFHVFLVPDRFTLGVEKDLCKYCFPDGYSRADVQSFTRYAIKTVGKTIKKCLSKEGTVILLKKIVEQNADKLKYYKNLTGYSFAKELFAAIASLRSSGISLAKVMDMVDDKEGVLYDKLHDVALIGMAYDSVLKDTYSDTITRLDSLNDHLQKVDLSKTYFYILGFNIYSEQQINIIKTLLKNSAGVAVSYVKLQGAEPCLGQQIYDLCNWCEDENIPVERQEAFELVAEPFQTVRRLLFTGTNEVVDAKDKIVLFSEDDTYAEATAVAREISYLVKKENFRYRDVAVVCNNNDLLPILYETFDRCEIPCFVDKGYQVTDGVFARFVIALFNAADKGSAEDYFRLSRQALCGLSVDEQELFRSYCNKYSINYGRFDRHFTLGDFEKAEAIRKKLTDLTAIIKECDTVKDYCDKIKELLSSFADKLKEYAASSDPRVCAYADTEGIEKLTEELTMLIGEEKYKVYDFLSVFCSAIADMKVVLRPEYCDTVFIGNTEESRFNDVKAIFVIGAADGFFPIKSGDGLIFTAVDNERMRSKELGLDISVFPSPVEKNSFERFIVRDLLSKPTVRLYVGCSVSDVSGSMQAPGEGFEELKSITGVKNPGPLSAFRKLEDTDLLFYNLVNLKNAYYEYLSDNIPDKYRKSVENLLKDKEMLKKMPVKDEDVFKGFFDKQDDQYVTSISQLQEYFSCPFKHFIKYGLKIRTQEDYVMNQMTIGNIVHKVLEDFFKDNGNRNRVYAGKNVTEETEKVIDNVFNDPAYESFYYNPLYSHYLDRLRVECRRAVKAIAESMRHSKFRPRYFEVRFGYPNDKNPILIDTNNGQFRMKGKVDRVDEYNDYVVIVDYKTGSAGNLADVYYGDKIQLYVYLKHFINNGKKPAGVFYQPIPFEGGENGRDYSMIGQMANKREIFRALDDRSDVLEDDEYSKSVRFKGDFTDGDNLLEERDFEKITEYVEKLVSKAIDEICEGYVERKPVSDGCANCDYQRLCGECVGRKKHAIHLADFTEESDD